jgi:hypothetical protein
MLYEPSHEEMELAELAVKYRDRLIEQASQLEQKYKDSATLDGHKERIHSYLELRQQHAEQFRELLRADAPDLKDGAIIHAPNRFGKESAKHFHIEITFESLATTDRADFDTFNSQQEAITEKISNTPDPEEREILKTTKLIEAYEHVAQTAKRTSTQNKQITGDSDNPESRHMTLAVEGSSESEGFFSRAAHLRHHYRELQPERAEGPPEPIDAPEKPQDRLDRLIEDQDRIARAKEELARTQRPKGRHRGR